MLVTTKYAKKKAKIDHLTAHAFVSAFCLQLIAHEKLLQHKIQSIFFIQSIYGFAREVLILSLLAFN